MFVVIAPLLVRRRAPHYFRSHHPIPLRHVPRRPVVLGRTPPIRLALKLTL